MVENVGKFEGVFTKWQNAGCIVENHINLPRIYYHILFLINVKL